MKVSNGVLAAQSNGEPSKKKITVPDCVQEGDLLFVDWKFDVGDDESNIWLNTGPYNDHSGIYIGNNSFIDPRKRGVNISDYYVYYSWAKNLVFLRVKTASESQRHAAVEWAKSKVGFKYQDFFAFPWFGLKIANTDLLFPTANKLYCTEILWAAYYIQGIDIDRNEWRMPMWVSTDDILYDDDVEVIYSELNNSTGIVKPNKGVYICNKKIIPTASRTLIFGDIDIEVVTYNDNVTRVEFFIDSVYKTTDISPPYSWRWTEHVAGKRVIKVVAYDSNGNEYYTAITVWKYF